MTGSIERSALDVRLRAAERKNDESGLRSAISALLAAREWRPLEALLARLDQISMPTRSQRILQLEVTRELAQLTRAVRCSCVEETEDGQPWRDCGRCAGSGKVPPRDPPPNPVLRWLQYAAQLVGSEQARTRLAECWEQRGLDRDTIERLWRLIDGENLATMEARRLAWRGWALIGDTGIVTLGPVAPPLPEVVSLSR